jgi:hypothetical protein
MKFLFVFLALVSFTACATNPNPHRRVASADQTGEITLKNNVVKYTIIDRGWRTEGNMGDFSFDGNEQVVPGPVPTIEAIKSYLIIHEAKSATSYKSAKVESALNATEQCQKLGESEISKPGNQVEGFKTTVSAKVINNLEMPNNFTLRYVCLVSVLAVKK